LHKLGIEAHAYAHYTSLLCFAFALHDNVNQFKNRLDKHWKMHDIVFNYRADFAETEGLA